VEVLGRLPPASKAYDRLVVDNRQFSAVVTGMQSARSFCVMEPNDHLIERLIPMWARMIAAMTEAVFLIDHAGRVIAANPAAGRLLDLPDQASALRPLDEYNHLLTSWEVEQKPFGLQQLRRSLAGETLPRQRATFTTAAGVEHLVQFTASPIRDELEQVLVAMLVVTDLTEAERTQAYWEAVGTAAAGLSNELRLDRVLESVADQLVAALGAQVVLGIWRLEAEQRLTLQLQRGLSEPSVQRLLSLPLAGRSLICQAVRTQQLRYLEDTRLEPPLDELDEHLVAAEDLAGLVCAPLQSGKGLWGGIAYGLRAPKRFYPQDLHAISTVAELFAIAIVHAELYEQTQELVGRLLVAEEEERRRVAYEIHDELAQVATSAHQHLQAYARHHRPRSRQAREQLNRVIELVQRTVREARRVVANLRPTELDDFGLVVAIRLQVEALQAEGWPATYQHTLADDRLPAAIETTLFRVAQEALTNIRKHAQTAQVEVSLEQQRQLIRLEIQDWGQGFELAAVPRGAGAHVGLAGMRERILLLGGQFALESHPGAGTRILAEVPLPAAYT
jgi:signal transduction histidine kinase